MSCTSARTRLVRKCRARCAGIATATPVVSTRVGAEGLTLTSGRDLVVTPGPEGMADAIVAGIRRPDELQDTAERGRDEVLAKYDWVPLADRLDAVWRGAVGHELVTTRQRRGGAAVRPG